MLPRVKMSLTILGMLLFFCAAAADSVIVRKEARLDILTSKQVYLNKRAAMLTSSGKYKGYRIQVTSTSKREEAFRIKSDLLVKFPDQKTYVLYQSPSFKVRIGNFIRMEDAENFKAQLNKLFPYGVYIVEDAIDYTPKDEEEIIPQ